MFQSLHIEPSGRVVDFSSEQLHSSSESQAYTMFFALAHHSPAVFDRAWTWSRDNLFVSSNTELPAWKWGRRSNGTWGVLDPNPASDADVWMAYALHEAGVRWRKPEYTQASARLRKAIVQQEVVSLTGLGRTLLPAPMGFSLPDKAHRLNPSYVVLPLFQRFAVVEPEGPWAELHNSSVALLKASAGRGFVPDWVVLTAAGRAVADQQTQGVGSYDSIRAYMWAAMVPEPRLRQTMTTTFYGMREAHRQSGGVPETTSSVTGEYAGTGPVGFSAALLPYFAETLPSAVPVHKARIQQWLASSERATDQSNYYNYALLLFGLGWAEGCYRFSDMGQLILSGDSQP